MQFSFRYKNQRLPATPSSRLAHPERLPGAAARLPASGSRLSNGVLTEQSVCTSPPPPFRRILTKAFTPGRVVATSSVEVMTVFMLIMHLDVITLIVKMHIIDQDTQREFTQRPGCSSTSGRDSRAQRTARGFPGTQQGSGTALSGEHTISREGSGAGAAEETPSHCGCIGTHAKDDLQATPLPEGIPGPPSPKEQGPSLAVCIQSSEIRLHICLNGGPSGSAHICPCGRTGQLTSPHDS